MPDVRKAKELSYSVYRKIRELELEITFVVGVFSIVMVLCLNILKYYHFGEKVLGLFVKKE